MIWAIELRIKKGIHCGFTDQVEVTLANPELHRERDACRSGRGVAAHRTSRTQPDNLIAAKKRQNKITEYRVMLQKWRAHGALTFAGYILGFPADKELILRDVEMVT